MTPRIGKKNGAALILTVIVSAISLEAAKGPRSSCTSNQFTCFNGKCIRRSQFCDGTDDCGDSSDEKYCERQPLYVRVCGLVDLAYCKDFSRCIPFVWKCDGIEDCDDGSDEKECQPENPRIGKPDKKPINGMKAVERNLTEYFLNTRQEETRSMNKWGPHVTRTAVALFLADPRFFAASNKTGEEIRYELSLQLLSKLALNRTLSTRDLALYINALTVACINPKDFYGMDMVAELRKRVNSDTYTNPFSFLTLCTAGDKMTTEDVLKLQQQYDANFRPMWTDTQAMVVMALSCISSKLDVNVDERTFNEMISKLKRKQHRNGTIDNLKTTALVIQALIAANSYRKDFNLDAAMKYILQEIKRTYPSFKEIYYILPVFSMMSLANISSDHCVVPIKADMEEMTSLRERPDERIEVQLSVIVGDNVGISRTWKVKVPRNYSLYQVLEIIGNAEPNYQLRYSVSDGKPYVIGLGNVQDDTEEGSFWFTYTKPLSSTAIPKLVEKSPVDIQVNENEEFILWYRSGYWANSRRRSSADSTATEDEHL